MIWHAVLAIVFIFNGFIPSEASQTPSEVRRSLDEAVASGSQALAAGDYATAERAFRTALAIEPTSIPILNNLAISLAREKREVEAIDLYKRALRLKPGDAITQRNLGVAYFRDQQYKLALPLLETFSTQSRSFQAFNLTGLDMFALDRYGEAAKYLAKAHALEPSDVQTLDMLGKAYMRTGNYTAVTEVFREMMATHPESAEAHVMMGMAYDKLFQEEDAIREYKAAASVDPKYPGIHTGLGVIYWRNDNTEAAEKEFREELSRYPDDPIANCTLGRILRRKDKFAEAVVYLEAALKANPDYRDALVELGESRIAMQQPELAIEPLKKAATLLPNDPEVHFVLGTALIKAGHAVEGARERTLSSHLRASPRSQQAKDRKS
jgi:Flp pilus assembly protein TadD